MFMNILYMYDVLRKVAYANFYYKRIKSYGDSDLM